MLARNECPAFSLLMSNHYFLQRAGRGELLSSSLIALPITMRDCNADLQNVKACFLFTNEAKNEELFHGRCHVSPSWIASLRSNTSWPI